MKDSKDPGENYKKFIFETVNEFRIKLNEINEKLDYIIKSFRDYNTRTQFDPDSHY